MSVERSTMPGSGEPCWKYEVTFVTRFGNRVSMTGYVVGSRGQAELAKQRDYQRLETLHGKRGYMKRRPNGDVIGGPRCETWT